MAREHRRSSKSPPFVMIYHSWMKAPAWRELSGNETRVFLHILRRYTGCNNGEISYSERCAALDCNISKTTARKCLKRLESIGWIRPTRKAHFDGKGIPTLWRVTMWPAFDRAASHNYLKWTPEQKA